MILIEAVLGNRLAPEWTDRLADWNVDTLMLDQWEAQKNRLRKRTLAGNEIAIALPRQSHLHDGDIIVADGEARTAIVVSITLKDVLVIELEGTQVLSAELIARTCFELGHALGNQHWPAVVKGSRVYVPLTVDRKVMDSVMRTHHFEHIRYQFIPGAEVIPYLAPHESRRLFGGADATPHSHTQSFEQAAPAVHEHPHEHEHTHEDGSSHTHLHSHAHQHPHAAAPVGEHRHAELHGNYTRHRHDHD
ncbi:urease accessory protein UreE [Crenobacter intestini]|uniref:Urease accessory protein UreE n=1 Tax=Crenobacter intestini TaxID=2563443 RepID=A0A4T0UP13_9NEIS|nr:urease accessory protein UreE [Crenobacter intestini]TIC80529.1 urease accessory protein UreE [Crenobacter intestini]